MKIFKITFSIIMFIITLPLLLFLVLTFTNKKLCGWEIAGERWPCYCIGKTEASSTRKTETIYYCTGFNLSCSKAALNLYAYFYPDVQLTRSCKSVLP